MPFFDKNEARVKMVALTKNGCENKVWYNLYKFNNEKKYSQDFIIRGMLRRVKEQHFISTVQAICFYDNQTGALIEKHTT